jgi:hypothetical protein
LLKASGCGHEISTQSLKVTETVLDNGPHEGRIDPAVFMHRDDAAINACQFLDHNVIGHAASP